jgi:triacylglycerol lipase
MSDAVLLIPGFFGFASFGRGDSRVSYFDHVAHALQAARPDLKGWIDVSEPPPTGSLSSRVQNLHDKILDVFVNGVGGDPKRKPDSLHLVGHSTGGLDARLLVSSRYALSTDRRSTFLDRLGAVVTVSAPLWGSPIGDRLGPTFRLSLPVLYLLSIAAKVREVAVRAGWTAPPLPPVLALVTAANVPDAEAIRLLLDLDATTAGDIARFLQNIVDDGTLIDDLKPENMNALNARIAGDAGRGRKIHQIVSVSPPPSFSLPDLLHPLASIAFHEIYSLMYDATSSPHFSPVEFPQGPWIPHTDRTLADDAPRANDGVVPSSSQTLDGQATAIVTADHLDVVGHFDSLRFRGATTIFRSDAGFDDTRFARLWGIVAQTFRA